MSDGYNARVSLGQVAQLLSAFAKKGFGSRQLTLFGQATPDQLEEMLQYLRGKRRMEVAEPRWWREGEDIVISSTNEDRSGAELLAQNPEWRSESQFSFSAADIIPKVDRIQGNAEFVLVTCEFRGESFEEVLAAVLNHRPDLEMAPAAAVFQITAVDVLAMKGVDRIVVCHEPISCEMANGPELFSWEPFMSNVRLNTVSTGPRGFSNSSWWYAREWRLLLKRK